VSSASSSLSDALRAVLLDPDEATALTVHGRTKAAVLVALYVGDGDLHAVFTRRRHDLRRHAGEISFPGGRADEGEGREATALREAHEERAARSSTAMFFVGFLLFLVVGMTLE